MHNPREKRRESLTRLKAVPGSSSQQLSEEGMVWQGRQEDTLVAGAQNGEGRRTEHCSMSTALSARGPVLSGHHLRKHTHTTTTPPGQPSPSSSFCPLHLATPQTRQMQAKQGSFQEVANSQLKPDNSSSGWFSAMNSRFFSPQA